MTIIFRCRLRQTAAKGGEAIAVSLERAQSSSSIANRRCYAARRKGARLEPLIPGHGPTYLCSLIVGRAARPSLVLHFPSAAATSDNDLYVKALPISHGNIRHSETDARQGASNLNARASDTVATLPRRCVWPWRTTAMPSSETFLKMAKRHVREDEQRMSASLSTSWLTTLTLRTRH